MTGTTKQVQRCSQLKFSLDWLGFYQTARQATFALSWIYRNWKKVCFAQNHDRALFLH